MTPYPTDPIFVAHRLFTGPSFPTGGTWGDLLDGPVTDEIAVIDAIIEAFKDEAHAPDRTDLRVWQIQAGKPAEDCTTWAIRTMWEALEDAQ